MIYRQALFIGTCLIGFVQVKGINDLVAVAHLAQKSFLGAQL